MFQFFFTHFRPTIVLEYIQIKTNVYEWRYILVHKSATTCSSKLDSKPYTPDNISSQSDNIEIEI